MEQTINPPDLDDLLAESRDTVFANMNCVQVGKIEKVNNDQTVEIKIQFLRRLPDGKTAKYPLLVDCPYFVLQGGGAYIDMPIKKGDDCLVLFNDRNIDDWWDTGNVAVPADTRKHSISDGFALVGINRKDKALDPDGSKARFIHGKSLFSLSPTGEIEIDSDSGKINVKITPDGKFTIVTAGAAGDLIVDNISSKFHIHLDSWGLPTSAPKPIGFTPPAAPAEVVLQSNIDTNSKQFDSVQYDQHGHEQNNDDNGDIEEKTDGPS